MVILVRERGRRAQWQAGPWKGAQLLHGGKKEERRGIDAGKFVDFMVEADGVSLVLLTALRGRRYDHPLDS